MSLFPNEVAGTYYVPPVKLRDSRNGRSIAAKGKLWSKVHNLVILSGEATPVRKKRKKISEQSQVPEIHNDIQLVVDKGSFSALFFVNKAMQILLYILDSNEDYIWLKHNSEPWTEVLQKWNATFDMRRHSNCFTVNEFLEQWPIINDLRADVLVSLNKYKYSPFIL